MAPRGGGSTLGALLSCTPAPTAATIAATELRMVVLAWEPPAPFTLRLRAGAAAAGAAAAALLLLLLLLLPVPVVASPLAAATEATALPMIFATASSTTAPVPAALPTALPEEAAPRVMAAPKLVIALSRAAPQVVQSGEVGTLARLPSPLATAESVERLMPVVVVVVVVVALLLLPPPPPPPSSVPIIRELRVAAAPLMRELARLDSAREEFASRMGLPVVVLLLLLLPVVAAAPSAAAPEKEPPRVVAKPRLQDSRERAEEEEAQVVSMVEDSEDTESTVSVLGS